MILVNWCDVLICELYVNIDIDFIIMLVFVLYEVVMVDLCFGYVIYWLKMLLVFGVFMLFDVMFDYVLVGFINVLQGQFFVYNGMFFNSIVLLCFGYQLDNQFIDCNICCKFGFKEDVLCMLWLGDEVVCVNIYISNDLDWIYFDIIIIIVDDQIVMVLGYLQSEICVDGKCMFYYVMDKLMLDFFLWIFGCYVVKKDCWYDIVLEVYYNFVYVWNVDDMLQSVKDLLVYYEVNFLFYQFCQLCILEFFNYVSFVQLFVNIILFFELVGFIVDLCDLLKIDYVYYVIVYEVVYQWWVYQVIGVNMQGFMLFSELLVQYLVLMVMKYRYGVDQMCCFFKYELDNYFVSCVGELVCEELLGKVEKNQIYIYYQKVLLVFYVLQDYVGEDIVNVVLWQFLYDKVFQVLLYIIL